MGLLDRLKSIYKTTRDFVCEHPALSCTIFIGFSYDIISNYWVFTSFPMAGDTESNPWKKAGLTTLLLLTSPLSIGPLGAAVDYFYKSKFVGNHRDLYSTMAITTVLNGGRQTLKDLYLVVSDVILAGQSKPDQGNNLALYIPDLVLSLMQGSMIGYVGYNLFARGKERTAAEQPLLEGVRVSPSL